MMGIQRADDPLDPRGLAQLAQERALIDALFASVAEDVERLQPAVARLRRARFFSETVRVVDEAMAARIPLQTLETRLIRLRQDWRVPEDSPRFLLLETAVRALAADALHALADLIAQGRLSPPVGADERLRAWAAFLAAPDLAEEPGYAEAARILQDAADALPRIRQFA